MFGALPGTGPDGFGSKLEVLIASAQSAEALNASGRKRTVGFREANPALLSDSVSDEYKFKICHNLKLPPGRIHLLN